MTRAPWTAEEKDRANVWFSALLELEIDQLGDVATVDAFDWREWGLPAKPSRCWLKEVERLRGVWKARNES